MTILIAEWTRFDCQVRNKKPFLNGYELHPDELEFLPKSISSFFSKSLGISTEKSSGSERTSLRKDIERKQGEIESLRIQQRNLNGEVPELYNRYDEQILTHRREIESLKKAIQDVHRKDENEKIREASISMRNGLGEDKVYKLIDKLYEFLLIKCRGDKYVEWFALMRHLGVSEYELQALIKKSNAEYRFSPREIWAYSGDTYGISRIKDF